MITSQHHLAQWTLETECKTFWLFDSCAQTALATDFSLKLVQKLKNCSENELPFSNLFFYFSKSIILFLSYGAVFGSLHCAPDMPKVFPLTVSFKQHLCMINLENMRIITFIWTGGFGAPQIMKWKHIQNNGRIFTYCISSELFIQNTGLSQNTNNRHMRQSAEQHLRTLQLHSRGTGLSCILSILLRFLACWQRLQPFVRN